MVCDGPGLPLTVCRSPGTMRGAKGALALPDAVPPAQMLPGDTG